MPAPFAAVLPVTTPPCITSLPVALLIMPPPLPVLFPPVITPLPLMSNEPSLIITAPFSTAVLPVSPRSILLPPTNVIIIVALEGRWIAPFTKPVVPAEAKLPFAPATQFSIMSKRTGAPPLSCERLTALLHLCDIVSLLRISPKPFLPPSVVSPTV